MLALCLLAAGAFLYLLPVIWSPAVEQSPPENPLLGKLYLTLVPKSGDTPLNLYSFDLQADSLEQLPLPGEEVSGSISPDGRWLAYARYDGAGVMQIFIADMNSWKSMQVTNDAIKYKRNPVWSPDGKEIAYIAKEVSAPHSHDHTPEEERPELWQIFVIDLAGNERFITTGTSPLFSPDGNALLVLKNDGIGFQSLRNLTDEGTLVWRMARPNTTLSHMKLVLSHDKRTLTWSNHHFNELLFFDVTWNPVVLKLSKKIETQATWAAFSPDDTLIAVEGGDNENDLIVRSRVDVYALDGSFGKTVLDLEPYDMDYLWLTEWR